MKSGFPRFYRVAVAILAGFALTTYNGRSEAAGVEQCKNDWSEGRINHSQYTWCVYNLEKKESDQIKKSACNEKVCAYRLNYISTDPYDFFSQGTFSGSGYILKRNVSVAPMNGGGLYTSILDVDTGGRRTILQQGCGNSCPGDPQAIRGSLKGATIKGPYGEGKDVYVILQIPASTIATSISQGDAHSQNEDDVHVSAAPRPLKGFSPLPPELKGKTLQYRIETSYVSLRPVREGTALKSQKIRFSESDDVYLFLESNQDRTFTVGGFIYKVNAEIDFVQNPDRRPKWMIMNEKSYLGAVTYLERTLTISSHRIVMAPPGRETNWKSPIKRETETETKILFSSDFRTCSVTEDSSKGLMGYTEKLKQSLECKVSN